jgi:D-aspartate ligase
MMLGTEMPTASGSVVSERSIRCSPRAGLGALVMGGDYRGLALVRNLGRHGVPVWVINQQDQRLAGASRYARRTLLFPSWQDKSGVEFLLELGQKHGLNGWLLFPTSDESVVLASSHHKLLAEQYQLTVPPWEELRWACDKRLMHQLADQIGVDHPRTYYPRCREDLASLDLTFPVILKPSSREQFNRLTAAKAWRADDMTILLDLFDEACKLLPPEMLMIQEVIPGGGEAQFSYAAVCKEGHPLASLVARRTRQFPMDFGRASTFVETVDDPGIADPAVRFLKAIRFTGLVEVEFKQDPRTGQFKLLDINPRVWGWYSLCEAAGVDFGYLLWLLHQGHPIPEVRSRVGVRWMRMSTDFLTSLREIWHGRMSVRDYLVSFRGPKASGIFASDDPWPGMLELPSLLYLLIKRAMRGRGI